MSEAESRSKTAPPEVGEKHWVRDLRNSFFAGLLVIVPVAASVGTLLWLFNTFTGWLIPRVLREPDGSVPFQYRVIALLLFVVLTIVLGWVTRLVVGKQMVRFTESLILRIPVLNKIYGFAKEVSDTMLGGKKTVFDRVVMVEYPRPGVYTIGFVTNEAQGEAQAKTKQHMINVFFPTTPNPTSGWLALVPKEQVIDLDMTVGEGMKLIISGGAVVPTYREKSEVRSQKPEGTT